MRHVIHPKARRDVRERAFVKTLKRGEMNHMHGKQPKIVRRDMRSRKIYNSHKNERHLYEAVQEPRGRTNVKEHQQLNGEGHSKSLRTAKNDLFHQYISPYCRAVVQ